MPKISTPKVSVILPCLNSATYIREALACIVGQSLRELEILVVDAGSTDGTAEILREYAEKDSRVRVLRSDKRSMGRQYNLGLDAARGAYIGFVESDDYIAPDMYESLYAAAEAARVDYVKANFDMFIDFPAERLFLPCAPIPQGKASLYNRVLGPRDLSRLVLRDICIWHGLYRKEFIQGNGIRFNETPGAAFQDVGFALQTLMFAKAAYYVKQSFYRYRKDNPGASSFKNDAYVFAINEYKYICGVINDIGADRDSIDLFEPLIHRRCFGLFNYTVRKRLYAEDYSKEFHEATEEFRQAFKKAYEGLGLAKRSRSGLWPPQNLLLFFEDFELYCRYTRLLVRNDARIHREAAEYFGKQREIAISGGGEIAGYAYCYLRRFGLNNIVAFCDEGAAGGAYMNLPLIGTREIAASHPNALYLITASEPDEARNRLMENGVRAERICYYGAGLDPHSCFELPVEV